MRTLFSFILIILFTYAWGQDQVVNGNITAGGPSGIYWSGFKSTGPAGKWGFQQNDVMMVGISGDLYSRGFSPNAMGIFNGSTTKEDVFLYNQNSGSGDFIVLKNTGNVGIGTVTPIGGLEVRANYGRIIGNGLYFYGSGFGSDGMPYARFNEAYGIRFNSPDTRWVFSSGPSVLIGYVPDGRHWGNGNLLVSEKVGIGTMDPGNDKLAVNGNIRAKEVKVETTNWPDYVFRKDYQLPSLAETEKHIQQKGHLPGIPSASEVKNNGVDLGEMNAKLLQKIEELTLHMIELKKENEGIKKELNKLKKINK